MAESGAQGGGWHQGGFAGWMVARGQPSSASSLRVPDYYSEDVLGVWYKFVNLGAGKSLGAPKR